MSRPCETPVQYIKGVGPAKAKLLQNLNIQTVEDLLYLFPRRYEDRSHLTPIASVQIGEYKTICGEVVARGGRQSWYTKKHIFETAVADASGQVFCVWFNQPYLDKYLIAGRRVVLYGKAERYKNKIQMISPEYEIIDEDDRSLNMNRIVPVYPLTKGVSQRYLRKIIHTALEQYSPQLEDVIPAAVRERRNLPHIRESIRQIHFPDAVTQQQVASDRASFEEFFLFQISVILRRMSIIHQKGIEHWIDKNFMLRFVQSLPFALTAGQIKAIEEIASDMKKKTPMLRLLQGDVGCGKTLVALFGCVAAVASGYQAAIMAPTEILAQQHFGTFQRLLGQGEFKSIRTAFLISSIPKRERDKILTDLKTGALDVVVGTHALVEDDVVFKNLSYVVIDEQHKFGVKQRALLSAKGISPDVLVMTATPIPRTLCLTLYGDLDVSTINEMPSGRGKIQTHWISVDQAPDVYKRVHEWVKKGTQAYIVYPIIEESEKLDLKAATDMYEHFLRHEFKDLRVGLLHGGMSRQETKDIMELFKFHKLDILVATTVLEVGIDVPNANVMVIEHAERFGLSQLHQLRGRIGRGSKNAICLLIADARTPEGRARLEAIVQTTDGFKIAQEDLKIRGPGHYFGRFQHGVNELRVANPLTQIECLEAARKEAADLLAADPQLQRLENNRIKDVIRKRYPEYLSMVFAG